jgi:hypothetical protein
MTDKLMYLDGQKAVDLWEGDEGWTILSGDNEEGDNAHNFYKFIPTLYRAVDIRMNSVAAMPFELRKKKGSDDPYDSSKDWQNKIGFMPNPFRILAMVEASLVVAGAAYLFRDKSALGTKLLRYHLPSSVTPEIHPVKGLQYFKRPVGGVEKKFKVEDYVYFWPADPFVEIGEAINFPAQAAANASGELKHNLKIGGEML